MFWSRKPREPASPAFLKPEGSNAYRVRIRTRRGEVVELRITKSGDISPDEGGFFVRKHVVGPRTFDKATLEVRFSSGYARPEVTVEGGEPVPVSDWD